MDLSFQLCLSPGVGVPSSWEVPQKAGLELSWGEQATIRLCLGPRRWVPLGKGLNSSRLPSLPQVSPRERGEGWRGALWTGQPRADAHGHQLLLPSEGTRGPVGSRLRQVLLFLNPALQRRPCPERAAGRRRLPDPFGCTRRRHTVTWGGGRWGWGPDLGRSDVTLQRGPAPCPQPTRGRLPLPTPGPARHPCNLIPAAATGTAGWDRLSPLRRWLGAAPPSSPPRVPPPRLEKGGRSASPHPHDPLLPSASPPGLQFFVAFPCPLRPDRPPYNLRPCVSGERASWRPFGLTTFHGWVPWGPVPGVKV